MTGKRGIGIGFGLAVVALLTACGGRLERAPQRDPTADAALSEAYGPPAEESGWASEADRTQAMEAKAAELQRNFDDAMANATTEQERQRAYEEFERGRLELNEMAESAGPGADGDAFGAPPEP